MNSFSSKNRASIIHHLNTSSFDVAVIGGGITGAGIALDASARGLKVALIDMQDFAAGTSSRSTKLIHGGLRYLKQMELKLVAEVGKEREIVHQNAPHLTKPERMLLPIVVNGSLGKFTSRIGMWIYEWLAGVKKEERHKVLSKKQTLETEPLLRSDNLLGGILFYEYRTDDARLTIEVMKEAVNRGAIAVNYMKATSFIYEGNKICGVNVQDQLSGSTHQIKTKYVVNAGGSWVDDLDDLDEKNNKHKLHITKGVHLVVDWKKLPLKQSSYFDTFDKRMLFVIPREGKTYIGTTDTFYTGDLVHPQITKEDKEYILKCVNAYYPNNQLKTSDIESAWAGLRPLVNKPGKGPSEISRKDELFISASGMITIAGGKLTGYRKMAERVVDKISENIRATENKKIPACSTHNIPLSGGKINGASHFPEFLKSKIGKGLSIDLTKEEAKLLVYRYGSNVDEIFTLIEQLKSEKNNIPVILRAQLHYAIHKEMCTSPADFFIRRIGALYFDIASVKKWKAELTAYMQNILKQESQLIAKFNLELESALEELKD